MDIFGCQGKCSYTYAPSLAQAPTTTTRDPVVYVMLSAGLAENKQQAPEVPKLMGIVCGAAGETQWSMPYPGFHFCDSQFIQLKDT